MTEREWLSSTDPKPMLAFVQRMSRRKLWLVGCACYRAAWDAVPVGDWREVVRIAERKADGAATRKEWAWARRVADVAHETCAYTTTTAGISHLTEGRFSYLNAISAAVNAGLSCRPSQVEQPALVRDIFGNPFRPVVADPRWLTSDVTGLAGGVYHDRAFDLLPVLADALEEAGCTHPSVLSHCRGPGPHALGCWIVDMVLGLAQVSRRTGAAPDRGRIPALQCQRLTAAPAGELGR